MTPETKDTIRRIAMQADHFRFDLIEPVDSRKFYAFKTFYPSVHRASDVYCIFRSLGNHCTVSGCNTYQDEVCVYGPHSDDDPDGFAAWAELAAEMEVAR